MGIFWMGVVLNLGLYISISLSSVLTHKILKDYDLALLVRLNISFYTVYLLLISNSFLLLVPGLIVLVWLNTAITSRIYTTFKDSFQMMFVFSLVLSILIARIFELIIGSNTKIVSFLNFFAQNKLVVLVTIILLALLAILTLLRSNLHLILLARKSGKNILANFKTNSKFIDNFIFYFGSFWSICFCFLSVLFASVNSQFALVWLATAVILNSVFENFKYNFLLVILWALVNSLLYLYLPSQIATIINFGILILLMCVKTIIKKELICIF
jgi:hypothetical protein